LKIIKRSYLCGNSSAFNSFIMGL